jgi:hypothetical protein
MYPVPGTPVNINGRTGTVPGPATTTAVRVAIPVPSGRQKLSNPTGTQVIAPSTTFARHIRVRNLDATNNLLVSFLDGVQVTVKPNLEEEFAGTIAFFSVQASASTVQWDATAIVAA